MRQAKIFNLQKQHLNKLDTLKNKMQILKTDKSYVFPAM